MKIPKLMISVTLSMLIFALKINVTQCYNLLQEPAIITCYDDSGEQEEEEEENYQSEIIEMEYVNCTGLSQQDIDKMNDERYQRFYKKVWAIQIAMATSMFILMIITFLFHFYMGKIAGSVMCFIFRHIVPGCFFNNCCYKRFFHVCNCCCHHGCFYFLHNKHDDNTKSSRFGDLKSNERFHDDFEKDDDVEDDYDDDYGGLPILSNTLGRDGFSQRSFFLNSKNKGQGGFVSSKVTNASKFIDYLFN